LKEQKHKEHLLLCTEPKVLLQQERKEKREDKRKAKMKDKRADKRVDKRKARK